MGLASSAANVSLLKRLYGSKVSETTYKRDALLELCKKDTNFRGEGKFIVVAIAPTAGGSADFAQAVAAQEATVERRFFVTRKREYQLYSIDNEAIEASKGDAAALVEILKRQVGGAKKNFDEALARRAHSPGGGAIGQIDTTTVLTTAVLKLRSRTSVVGLFYKNLVLEFAATNGTGSSPGSTRGPNAQLRVVSVDRNAGTVTLSGNLNTIVGITVNDFVFRAGDFANAMTGIQGWEPTADPSGANPLFGVDQTEDMAKLSGVRVVGGGKPKEETLQDAGAEAMINGINVTHCIVNPLDFKDLGKELGAQKIQEGGTGVTGFSKLIVYTAAGAVELRPSPFCAKGFFWMGDASTLTLGSAGEMPMDLAAGNGGTLLLPTSDARQGRLGGYGNFWVDDPGQWVIGSW
jgi:hypothetical protein